MTAVIHNVPLLHELCGILLRTRFLESVHIQWVTLTLCGWQYGHNGR